VATPVDKPTPLADCPFVVMRIPLRLSAYTSVGVGLDSGKIESCAIFRIWGVSDELL